jgi:hypothetical protein
MLQAKQGIRLPSYMHSKKFKILSELCQRLSTSFGKTVLFISSDGFCLNVTWLWG